jgi:hypothetical protein
LNRILPHFFEQKHKKANKKAESGEKKVFVAKVKSGARKRRTHTTPVVESTKKIIK